jgi:hypothetical protein
MTTADYLNKVLGPEKDQEYWNDVREKIGITMY